MRMASATLLRISVLAVLATTACKPRKFNNDTNAMSYDQHTALAKAAADAAFKNAVSETKAIEDFSAGNNKKILFALTPSTKDLDGSWELTVFPKVAASSEKSEANTIEFGRPYKFEFTAQRRFQACKSLYKEISTSKKWHAAFFDSVKNDTNLKCAIIRVSMKNDKPVNRSVDDVAEVRMYIDDMYRAYGTDIDTYKSDLREINTNFVPYERHESISSGLGSFPIDLPNLLSLASYAEKSARDTKFEDAQLALPSDKYVSHKLEQSMPDLCKNKVAYNLSYRDYYGSKVKVGWCKGDAWPTTIDNRKFFAVTTRKPKH